MVFADNKLLILIIGGFLVAALAACSIPGHHYATVERLNAEGDFAGACRYVEEHAKDYGMGNRLLYELDRGTLAFAAGDYPDAIEAFTEAERLMENLYTISLINEATTWVINDNMAPYRGEDFESVLVNLFLALSYANLGQVENALVEVRKIDSKLAAINLQYDEAHKNAYQEDPFARLLMGILYEMGRTSGDLNDAYISYYLAMKGYESEYSRYGTAFPRVLAENALSLAEFMGEKQLQLMRRSLPHLSHPSLAERRELAEVYCFHFNGRAPVKMEEQIFLPLPDGYIAKVAFPRYQRILEQIAARLHAHSLEDDREYQSEFALAEPIDSIAIENLKNRQGRIMLKATVRATAKYFAVKVGEAMMQTDEGIVPGLIIAGFGNLMALTSEQADLRSWRTLPAEILISKLTIPPGSYRFWAECADNSGSPTKRLDLGKRQLQAGDKVFLQFTTRQGSFPSLEEERGQLFVSTNPPDAMVRVLNIGPRFHQQGMRLEPGKYNLEISAPGYETEITWTELSSGEDKRIAVDLREIGRKDSTAPVHMKR